MTPIMARIAREIAPQFPSGTPTADTQRSIFIQIDSRDRVAFDSDGLANDLAGTAHFIVSETTGHDGWFGNLQTTYRSKRFSYFLRDGRDLILRELNPSQTFNPTSGLNQAPVIRMGFSPRSGPSARPPTFEEAQAWATTEAGSDPISIFVGNIDSRPGNEIEFLRRGIRSMGILNIAADLFGRP